MQPRRVVRALFAVTLTASVASGCDQGEPHDTLISSGPPIQIIGTNVGIDKPLPADGRIEIAVDRLLNPFSVTRQSFALASARGESVNALVTYDPIARVVRLSNPGETGAPWLVVDQSYTVTFGIPTTANDVGGIRAIDGQTLDPSAKASSRKIGFKVEKAAGVAPEPRAEFCNDVLPLFQARCSSSSCHGAPQGSRRPAAGLLLETAQGVLNTAIGRVAHGANTTASSNAPLPPGPKFGPNMPLIEPGDPAHSWLLYKLLLARPSESAPPAIRTKCSGEQGTPPIAPFVASNATFSKLLSPSERAILSDRILGREMPYPSDPGAPLDSASDPPALTFDELERVRLWIAGGANVTECGACEP